jgi:hypothetical protein
MNNDAEAALVDAKKCVRMSNAWPKGHARKGDALMKKRLFKPALEAYERAVELDPTNAGYAEKTANAKRLDEQRRGVGGAGGGGSGPRVVPIGKSGASAASAEGASAAAGPAASAAASAAAGSRKSALGVRLLEPSYLARCIHTPCTGAPPHDVFCVFVPRNTCRRVRSTLSPRAPTDQVLCDSVWSQPAPPAPSAWPQMMCLPVVLAPGLLRWACNSCDWSPNALHLLVEPHSPSLPSFSPFVSRFVLALLGCFASLSPSSPASLLPSSVNSCQSLTQVVMENKSQFLHFLLRSFLIFNLLVYMIPLVSPRLSRIAFQRMML